MIKIINFIPFVVYYSGGKAVSLDLTVFCRSERGKMKVSEIDNMAFESLLYDFYGVLLTDKQREVMELYHEENYSIVEIARELKVSKQAIYDNLKKSDSQKMVFESRGFRFVVAIQKDNGNTKNWLLTAFDLTQKPK